MCVKQVFVLRHSILNEGQKIVQDPNVVECGEIRTFNHTFLNSIV